MSAINKSYFKSILLVLLLILSTNFQAATVKKNKLAADNLTVDPQKKLQVWEGWGGSLCWWAHIMGSYPDAKIEQICNWITHPTTGLNMNLFRFNIGGGDAPGHNHMRTDGGDMPGYKATPTSAYNWNSDAGQRKMLQQLIASRIANTGKNDIQLVAFSNSPPWWMTVSGCVSGGVNGNTTNLKPDMFDDFAAYLTDVTKYYHDSLGIRFHHLEPFNEPYSTWWTANKPNGQEGCYFSQHDQEKMIRELHSSLKNKDMLKYCKIAVMDANSIDEAHIGLEGYKTAGDIMPLVDRLDIHSYAGNKRNEIRKFAAEQNKKVWQSESGPLSVGGSNEHQLMVVAQRIVTDIREMDCTAWLDWQLANDLSPLWGMLVGNYKQADKPVKKGPSFYLRAQFSRYIKPGYSIVHSSNSSTIAALSPDKSELVLIYVNSSKKSEKFSLKIAGQRKFELKEQIETSIQPLATVYTKTKTSNQKSKLSEFEVLPQSVTTLVVKL